MVIQIRNTSNPNDVWAEFIQREGFWEDEDGIRPEMGIELALEMVATEIQKEQLWKDAHESI